MKKIILPIIILSLFLSAGVFAQETELPDPGMTPDSPFYFLERITEAVGTFFTFGDLKKAERHAALAAERLAEAQLMAEKGRTGLTEKTLARYEMQLQNSIARAEKAQAKEENAEKIMEVMTRAGKATSKHLEVLAEVYEKVPEEAKPAIEQAIKVSVKGHKKAVEALKAQNALGEVPEEVSLPMVVPAEVRERVRTRVQQELQIEEALQGIDTSKSLRNICAEQGGTPEMCEQFPLEKFESFEQIESFCAEKGGPPEVCASVEDKCREFGVTRPNECFIMLSVSSIKTYTATELKVGPAPPLSEEEMEERRIQMEVKEEIEEEKAKCLKEGETYMPGEDRQCCAGLKGISLSVGDGRICSLTAGYVCTAFCGDGKCEGKYENPCNCPEDCPKSEKEEVPERPISCKDSLNCPSKMKCENSVCVDVRCIGEGGMGPSAGINPEWLDHLPTECCEGLKSITYSGNYNENCNFMPPPGAPSGVCSKCGNDICEKWETKCNCSEDCK